MGCTVQSSSAKSFSWEVGASNFSAKLPWDTSFTERLNVWEILRSLIPVVRAFQETKLSRAGPGPEGAVTVVTEIHEVLCRPGIHFCFPCQELNLFTFCY